MQRAMKDSGIEWLGEVPADWDISTIKREYVFQTGGTPDTTQEKYFTGENIWVTISDMKSKVVYDSEKHISDEAVQVASMNISPKGSLLYAFKLSVGAVSFCGDDMYTNEAIATFLSDKNSLRFLYYMAPIFIIKNANENIYGAKLLNQKLIRNAKIVAPPYIEQRRIADYLDRKCGQIDAIIARQQEVIEKLKAYKRSVITEAVTKGLNPNVPMKESGIEWIGKIPADWDIRRLRFLCTIETGNMDTQDNNPEGEYPFYVRSPIVEHCDSFTFDNEAVLMAGDGVGAGKTFHYVKGKYGCHQRVYSLHSFTDAPLLGKYLYYYLLENFYKKIEESNAKSTVDSIRLPMIKDFPVVLPPCEIQYKTIDYLDCKCEQIDATIIQKQALIEKLKAYRKSLIYEVVTGKKEV